MPIRSSTAKFVTSADGLMVYAEAAGDPSKPHVIFVHGFTFSSVVWDAQFSDPKLLDNIYAIRYDLRGHGRTGKPAEQEAWDSQRLAEDFDAVVQAFNLKKPVFVGWSYGASVVADVVNAFGPRYLSGIVYIGALAYTPDEFNFVCPRENQVFLMLQDQSLTPDHNYQLLTDFLGACWADPESIPLEARKSWSDAMLAQPLAARKLAASRTQDKRRFWVEAGSLPLLVIHGKQDKLCPHDALMDEVKTKFKHVEIESWDGVGHVPFIERVDEFDDVIVRWAGKVYTPLAPLE